jgi:hypothetical protein
MQVRQKVVLILSDWRNTRFSWNTRHRNSFDKFSQMPILRSRVTNFYNATGSLARFKNKNIIFSSLYHNAGVVAVNSKIVGLAPDQEYNNVQSEHLFVSQQDWGPVSSLSFRSDRSDLLVSGSGLSGCGHIAVWDLVRNWATKKDWLEGDCSSKVFKCVFNATLN